MCFFLVSPKNLVHLQKCTPSVIHLDPLRSVSGVAWAGSPGEVSGLDRTNNLQPVNVMLLLLLFFYASLGRSSTTSPTITIQEWDNTIDPTLCPLPAPVEIDCIEHSLSDAIFEQRFRERRPVLLRQATSNWSAHHEWTRPRFIQKYGKLQVGVGGSTEIVNNAGRSPERIDVATYVHRMARNNSKQDSKQEDELYAFDGDFFAQKGASEMLEECQPLPVSIERSIGKYANGTGRSIRYLGLGKVGSGVGWHSHVEGWLFQLHGAKSVFLYPPDVYPPIEMPSWRDQRDWYHNVLPRLFLAPVAQPPQRVMLRKGDTLYIPSGWHHSTLNCGDSLSVAIQLRPQEPLNNPDHMQFAANIAQAIGSMVPPSSSTISSKHKRRRHKKMVDQLLTQIVKFSPLRVHPRMWLSEHLQEKGGTKNNREALRHARVALSMSPHVPRVRLVHAFAVGLVMRDFAVLYAKASKEANVATSREERERAMMERSEAKNMLMVLTKEWSGTMDRCVDIDSESPLLEEKGKIFFKQYKSVFPKSLRGELNEMLEGTRAIEFFSQKIKEKQSSKKKKKKKKKRTCKKKRKKKKKKHRQK